MITGIVLATLMASKPKQNTFIFINDVPNMQPTSIRVFQSKTLYPANSGQLLYTTFL